MNSFCSNKKVLGSKVEFFKGGKGTYWTVFIEYEPVLEEKGGIDAGFSEAQRLLFERLRQWRRENAEELGIPVYIVATNRQLVEVVQKTPKSLEALKSVRGFGKKKVERFGKQILGLVREFHEVGRE